MTSVLKALAPAFTGDARMRFGGNCGPGHSPGVGGVPPFPSPDWARLPDPPLLDPQDPDGHWFVLQHAYTGACQWRGIKLPPPNRVNAFHIGGRVSVHAAADMLLKLRIPPISWASWSVDQWARRSKKHPPVPWVWAPRRIELERGWYRRESGAFGGGKMIFGPSAREMLKRYSDMRAALVGVPAAGVPAVVAKFFPDDLYTALFERSKIEASAERFRLAKALADGKWLWDF